MNKLSLIKAIDLAKELTLDLVTIFWVFAVIAIPFLSIALIIYLCVTV